MLIFDHYKKIQVLYPLVVHFLEHKEFLDRLGINRATTLDYLNLQALGIKDYQRIIATTDNQNTLTIRDRIAYARRHEWIDKVGHGVRTPEMTKLRKKKEGK